MNLTRAQTATCINASFCRCVCNSFTDRSKNVLQQNEATLLHKTPLQPSCLCCHMPAARSRLQTLQGARYHGDVFRIHGMYALSGAGEMKRLSAAKQLTQP
mmetsp:Transcript_51656/g.102687  ORF Transcript_51656/g.102687 Transcript_51656/m.102687 type:complete len:101 (+) Transcript_51656:96-398(+)